MPTCSVFFCKKRSQTSSLNRDNISFHMFPKDLAMREAWIQACGNHATWTPKRRSTVCSLHFEPKCYMDILSGKPRLEPTAIPTLKLPNLPVRPHMLPGAVVLSWTLSAPPTSMVTDSQETGTASGELVTPENNLGNYMPLENNDFTSNATSPMQDPEPSHNSASSTFSVPIFTEEINIPIDHIKVEKDDDFEPFEPEAEVKVEDENKILRQTIRDIAAKLDALSVNDSYDAFGKYVASVMRSLPKHKAMRLQPKIIGLLVLAASSDSDED